MPQHFFDILHSRRSIREYTSTPVAPHDVYRILDAGMVAPSAGNQQPWQFIVLDDKSLLHHIPTFHPHASMLSKADTAIVVCGDPNAERHKGFWVQDCSAATQNMLLAARALNLGGVWVGLYPEESRMGGVRALLSIPEYIIPFSIISLGHTDVTQKHVSRFAAHKVHSNGWQIKG